MPGQQFHEERKEKEPVHEALEAFFSYVDRRSATDANPPPEVNDAFETIMRYYTGRLKRVVRLLPSEYFLRMYESEDLYNYAWAKFWLHGQTIKIRTAAGVYRWLKTVIINHKTDLKKKYGDLTDLEPLNKIEKFLQEPDSRAGGELMEDGEVQYRCELIREFFEKALSKLNQRRQQVIRLVNEGHSLADIAQRMNFSSRNAVSSFKRRAFKRIAEHLGVLFARELNHRGGDLRRKEIIVELLERFNLGGGTLQCLMTTA